MFMINFNWKKEVASSPGEQYNFVGCDRIRNPARKSDLCLYVRTDNARALFLFKVNISTKRAQSECYICMISFVNRHPENELCERTQTIANEGNRRTLWFSFFFFILRHAYSNRTEEARFESQMHRQLYAALVAREFRKRGARMSPINKSRERKRDNKDKSSAIRNAAPLFLVTRRCN